jgi:hypothetical protein
VPERIEDWTADNVVFWAKQILGDNSAPTIDKIKHLNGMSLKNKGPRYLFSLDLNLGLDFQERLQKEQEEQAKELRMKLQKEQEEREKLQKKQEGYAGLEFKI